MTQKPLPWPPRQGEIWVAMAAWCRNGRSSSISAGTHLLVVSEPGVYNKVDDSRYMEVLWEGGRRRIVAAPDDLMPLEWLAPLGDI